MTGNQDPSALPWTGERYVPQVGGNIRLEHLHRYLLARELAHGKSVLDIACGEGYGSDILGGVAAHVVGVDIAPDVIAHATSTYGSDRVEFREGSCEAIPLPDHSVDLVVSFETLEHVRAQDLMMREVQRVLRPGGQLFISSPDRREYTDVLGNRNPFHVQELDRQEFEGLLRSHFAHVSLAGQRIRAGSLVGSVDQSARPFVSFDAGDAHLAGSPGLRGAEYLLALASDAPLAELAGGVLDGGPFSWVADLGDLLSKVQAQCTVEIARRLGATIDLEGASNEAIRAEFGRQADRVSELGHRVAELDALLRSASQNDAARATEAAQRQFEIGVLLTRTQSQLLDVTERLREWRERLIEEQDARRVAEQRAEQLSTLSAACRADADHTRAERDSLSAQVASLKLELEKSLAAAERAVALEATVHDKERQVASSREHARLAQLQADRASTHAATLVSRLQTLHGQVPELVSLVHELQAQIAIYARSRSWRITAPLRALRRGAPEPASEHRPLPAMDLSPVSAPSTDAVPGRFTGTSEAGAETAVGRGASVLPHWIYEEKEADYVALARTEAINTRMKLIAFYLPQFHPIPENDAWWGKGFTEWTSVSRGKPQFEGHYQPRLPGELGFYDLRLPQVQQRQIELARLHGLHGFCYYHYWFQGRTLLRQPLDQLLSRPELDFPFCLCWANESWTRRWDGQDQEVLMAQQHSPEDDLAFIKDIEPALRDPRYIRVGNRLLLLVYRAELFGDAKATAERWRSYCRTAGIGELFLMATESFQRRSPHEFGFDAALEFAPNNIQALSITAQMPHLNPNFRGAVYDYRHLVKTATERTPPDDYLLFRSVTPSWDNEGRRPSRGTVFAHSTPSLYEEWLTATCQWTEAHVSTDNPLVFVNAWNEWAEGAHLEPDRRYGYAYLAATARALQRFPVRPTGPRLVVVSHDAYFHGAQVLALNLVKTLTSRLGYHVDVILEGPGPLAADFEAAAPVHDFWSATVSLETKRRIATRLFEQGARLAICNTSVVGQSVELLKEAGFFVVSVIHELPGLIAQHKLEASVASIKRHADRLVFPADIVRDRFLADSPELQDRAIVQPQGLFAPNRFFGRKDTARQSVRQELGLSADAIVVLGMGYADHRKGIDLFAEVGIKVTRERADVTFVWVGHHEEVAFAAAQAVIAQSGQADRFVFTGAIRDADSYFAAADLFLMTSREDPFPSVVLQALDVEVPVIAFRGGGGFERLLERDCGVLVPLEDTDAMADAVLRLTADRGDAAAMAAAGQAILSREFSFVNYARRLATLNGPVEPKISVIVPNYNYARYLRRRLQSIVQQTLPPHEVIFLDDCSTDESVRIAADTLHGSGLAFRIITNQTNQGTYKQWLRGLQEATGDLIWIAEADDDCSPQLLERLTREFDRPATILAYCQSKQIDEHGRQLAPDYLAYTAEISATKWGDAYVRPGRDEIRDTLVVKNTIPNVSAVVMRRIDIAPIAGRLTALRNAGDWLLYAFLLEQGDVAFVPETLNSHRRHGGSVTIGKGGLNLMREILLVQQHLRQHHEIAPETERVIESSLQQTYDYLGLGIDGPASFKDHPALQNAEWALAP